MKVGGKGHFFPEVFLPRGKQVLSTWTTQGQSSSSEVSSSLLDGASGPGGQGWSVRPQALPQRTGRTGWSSPVSRGWEVGGNHYFCLSCWSKIASCPCSFLVLALPTELPSARHFALRSQETGPLPGPCRP